MSPPLPLQFPTAFGYRLRQVLNGQPRRTTRFTSVTAARLCLPPTVPYLCCMGRPLSSAFYRYLAAGVAALVATGCTGLIQKPAPRQPAPAGAPEPVLPTPPASRRMQIFLLAGQSNMAGRGKVDSTDTVAAARVWALDSTEQWVPARDPIHFDKSVAGVGPGRSFGIALVEADRSVDVGLVPAAVGGTAISSWAPGALDAATKTHPYDDAIRRARVALQRGELAGILWHQGEGDGNATAAPHYEERLRALIARIRQDLGADVPFIMGQVGRFPARPWDKWRALVDSANRRIVATVPRTALVSSAGLTDIGDRTHFDARSARELGRRYAVKYLDIMFPAR